MMLSVVRRLSEGVPWGSCYYRGLRALGVPALNRRYREAGLVLCYHNVVPTDDDADDSGLHVPRAQFERQMRWLVDRYRVVSLRELLDRLASGSSLRSVAAVTFDDGYAGVFELGLPILRDLRIPASVFLVSDAVGRASGFCWDCPGIAESMNATRRRRWLTDLRGDGEAILASEAGPEPRPLPAAYRPADWPLIRASLAPGIDIGGHSATHRTLPTLDDGELEYEIVASREKIHAGAGVWPVHFAYPYGQWTPRVRERVRAAGYRAALTLDDGLNRRSADPWLLRRVNVPAGISDAAFESWTAGLAVPSAAR